MSELQAKILLIRGFTDEGELLRQRNFAEQLKKPLTTTNYNVLVLKKKGYMTSLNNLTPDGKAIFLKLKRYLNNTKKLRGHKIFGTFMLSEAYVDFEKVKKKYLRISSSPKHKGFKLEFKECIILFYSPKKLCFYLPDVYGDGIAEIYAEAYEQYIFPLKNNLEQMFPTLKINQYEIASVTINHLAFQNHPLAEVFKEYGVRYKSDRIEVDHSETAELETVHKDTAVEDMDRILDYENWIRGSFSRNDKNKEQEEENDNESNGIN